MNKTVPLFWPQIYKEEWLEALSDVFNTRWIGQGPMADKFEQEFGAKFNYDYCLSVNSGTSALELAYHLIGIGEGDEVLTTVFSCTASNLPLLRRKANIKFVDINHNLVMDPLDVDRKINKNTKAIVVVTLGGMPIDKHIFDIAKVYNVPVIIDAAQSLGVTEQYGDIICYSFQAIKHFNCFPSGTKIVYKPPIGSGKGCSCTKNIENIQIGDIVLTYNESTSQKEFKPVINTFINKCEENLIKIKLDNHNELEMTKDHPIYVINKGYVKAKDLQLGDRLLQYNYRALWMRLAGKQQKDKTYEDIYDVEKAKNIKDAQSIAHSDENHHYYGEHRDEETKQKISKSNKGRIDSEQTKIAKHIGQKEKWNKWKTDPNFKEIYDNWHKSIINANTDEVNLKRSIKCREIMNLPEYKEIMRNNTLRLWKDSDYREKVLTAKSVAMDTKQCWQNWADGMNKEKNSIECKLNIILDEVAPGEFIYNGNFDAGVVLDYQIPDFVNTNGKKKVIDLFGTHWHSEFRKGISPEDQETERIRRFNKVGWDCLIIWEHELRDVDLLKNRIENFIYNPNTKIVKIVSIEEISHDGPVYNIETEDNHNYFAYGLLVHNCADGGMLVLRNKDDYDRAKKLRWFGIDREAKKRADWKCMVNHQMAMEIEEAGYKYHMNDVAAAIGLVGLKHSNEILEYRKLLCDTYMKNLWLKYPFVCGGSYWLFAILSTNRDEVMDHLQSKGIECDLVQLRNDIFKVFGGQRQDLPNMNELENKYLYLPLNCKITIEDVNYICEELIKCLR